ncbi:MAG: Slp family lipoprotein [Thiogranum sp.]|nr:Slp family lipoprotein [Thiogranum sp.]
MRLYVLPALLLLLLAGCASGPTFDTTGVDRSVTPRAAVAEFDAQRGKSVIWGGVILDIHNLADSTRLEVLGYPLDSSNRPQRDADPLGRFVIERSGFLEPASYSQGRLVTVVGKLAETESGKVGGSDYTYPVIEAARLHLWEKTSGRSGGSNVHFGIGVGIGL